jgi:hypothetical protein
LAVAIAIKPREFAGGIAAADGSNWELFGEKYAENPKFKLTENDMEMVKLWRLFTGGMAPGFLPESGGLMDQAAIMIDAFGIMSAAESDLKAD